MGHAIPIVLLILTLALPAGDAQIITGGGTISGGGEILIADNCSRYRDGDANPSTGSDKNLHLWISFPLVTSANFELCRATWIMDRTGNPAGTVTMSIWAAGLTFTPLVQLAESGAINLSAIPTTAGEVAFTGIGTSISSGGNYALVLHYTNPVGGGDPDFVRHHRVFTGEALEKSYRSTDPNLGWSEDNQSAHAAAKLFSQ